MPRVPESTWKQLRDDLRNCQGQAKKVINAHARVLHAFRRRHPSARLNLPDIYLYGDELEPVGSSTYVKKKYQKDHPFYPIFTKGGTKAPRVQLQMPIGNLIDFRNADLRDSYFAFTAMEHCDFRGADLRGAMFTGTMKWCFFKGANLQGATFLKGSMICCDTRDVCFDNAIFASYYLKCIRTEGSTFNNVILRRCRGLWGYPSLDVLPDALAYAAYEKPYSALSPKCKRYLWRVCGSITRQMLEADGDLEEFASLYPDWMSRLD